MLQPSGPKRNPRKPQKASFCISVFSQRTFILLVVGELPLERTIDHVGEAVLGGSRAREVGLGVGDGGGGGIDLLRRRRVGLGRIGGREEGKSERRNAEGENEKRKNRGRSDPHCEREERVRRWRLSGVTPRRKLA